MADVRGRVGQKIVWDWFVRVFGFPAVSESLMEDGLDETSANRTAFLMRARWEEREVEQSRPGHKHFPRFVDKLVNKPEPTPPFGDYSAVDEEIFVLGSRAVQQIRAVEPAFVPITPTKKSYQFEDIYDGFQYMERFTSSIARFLALEGTVWVPYIGESDSQFPDIPSFTDEDYE